MRITRRDFLLAGGMAATGTAIGKPIRGSIGGRIMSEEGDGGKPTAADYVQDGLIAMWDGIENAGWGVHDASATTWKDCIAGNIIQPTVFEGGSAVFGPDSVILDHAIMLSQAVGYAIDNQPFTIEVVTRSTTTGYAYATTTAVYGGRILEVGNYGGKVSVGVRNGYMPIKSSISSGSPCSLVVTVDGTNQRSYANATLFNERGKTRYGNTPFSLNYSYARDPNPTANTYRTEYCALRTYSRELTADEVAANYAIDAQRFSLV